MQKLVNKASEIIPRLTGVRGSAHQAVIGEWIRCWRELEPENNLVLNEAPVAVNHTADIMFLEPEYEVIEGERQPAYWTPAGVAEIENNRVKWFEKVESLIEYIQKYPLKFVLLCVKVYTNSKLDNAAYNQLIEKIIESSQATPKVSWILYKLNESPWKEDASFPIAFDPDSDAMIWFYRFVSSGEGIVFKDGNIELRAEHYTS